VTDAFIAELYALESALLPRVRRSDPNEWAYLEVEQFFGVFAPDQL